MAITEKVFKVRDRRLSHSDTKFTSAAEDANQRCGVEAHLFALWKVGTPWVFSSYVHSNYSLIVMSMLLGALLVVVLCVCAFLIAVVSIIVGILIRRKRHR